MFKNHVSGLNEQKIKLICENELTRKETLSLTVSHQSKGTRTEFLGTRLCKRDRILFISLKWRIELRKMRFFPNQSKMALTETWLSRKWS